MNQDTETDLSVPVGDLDEDAVLDLVSRRLAEGEDPLRLLEECQRGVRLVGERYEKGIYYISGLIMASAILHEVSDMIVPNLKNRLSGSESGQILLGTVEGDIHYIGKDIVKELLLCHGFTVTDLGVDVPAAEFVAKTGELKPHIVGMSCLLTVGYESMRNTIDALRTEARSSGWAPSLIIGGLVDRQVSDYVGADAWTTDAMTGVRLCQDFIRKHNPARSKDL